MRSKTSAAPTVIFIWNRSCCLPTNLHAPRSNLKSITANRSTAKPVYWIGMIVFITSPRKWNNIEDMLSTISTRSEEAYCLPTARKYSQVRLSAMCPKTICAVFKSEKRFSRTLKKKKPCLIWVSKRCHCFLSTRLPNTVNMMKTAKKF